MVFEVKPFDEAADFEPSERVPPSEDVKAYRKKREEFQQTVFKVIKRGPYIRLNYNWEDKLYVHEVITEKVLKEAYNDMAYYSTVNSQNGDDEHMMFINKWILDPLKKSYADADMYPDESQCPDNCFNLWTPFAYAELTDAYTPDLDAIRMFKQHLFLMGGKEESTQQYLINWIAHMFQKPYEKSTMPVITSKEGTGKNILLCMLTRMLGRNKVFECTNPGRDVFGQFNDLMGPAFLVNFSEVSTKDFESHDGQLKGLIYDPTIPINGKHLTTRIIRSFHRFITFTNQALSVKISESNRRVSYIRASDSMIGRRDYFGPLVQMIQDQSALRTIYDYLMDVDLTEFNPQQIHRTRYGEQVKQAFTDSAVGFLRDNSEVFAQDPARQLMCTYASEIRKLYEKWCEVNGTKCILSSSKVVTELQHALGDIGLVLIKPTTRGNMGIKYILDWVNIYKYMNPHIFLSDSMWDEEGEEEAKSREPVARIITPVEKGQTRLTGFAGKRSRASYEEKKGICDEEEEEDYY
jgi:hypothetical protein